MFTILVILGFGKESNQKDCEQNIKMQIDSKLIRFNPEESEAKIILMLYRNSAKIFVTFLSLYQSDNRIKYI